MDNDAGMNTCVEGLKKNHEPCRKERSHHPNGTVQQQGGSQGLYVRYKSMGY
jgi:hypothetical protein